jgi:hypothetical protein
MQRFNSPFIRNIEAGIYLEFFLLSAIVAILTIRLLLMLTGYPQIGGHVLHIAHMLWGGLLMLASIFLLLSFLGRRAERLASIVGGIGFGTFIDEVGKFITQDNNYFYQPSVAIIYVIFILLVLISRSVLIGKKYSSREYMMNALREMEEVARNDLDIREKERAIRYLNKSGSDSDISMLLKKILGKVSLVSLQKPGIYSRVKETLHRFYQKVADLPAFSYAIIIFFLFQFLIKLAYLLVMIFFWGIGWHEILNVSIFHRIIEKFQQLSFAGWAELISSMLAGFFIFLGIWFLRRSRLLAYRMFERSILISIFLTQVFQFYKNEFGALAGLIFNLLIYLSLRFLISREIRRTSESG